MSGVHGLLARAAALGVLVSGLFGCAATPDYLAGVAAEVSRPTTASAEERAYGRRLGALIARDGLERLDKAYGIGPSLLPDDISGSELGKARRTLAAIAEPAYRGEMPLAEPETGGDRKFYRDRWRVARQTLYLAPPTADSGVAPYAFSGLQAIRTEIELRSIGGQPFRLTLACDGAVAVEDKAGSRSHPAGVPFTVIGGDGAGESVLVPSDVVKRCDAMADFDGRRRAFAIVREETENPRLADFDSRVDVCRMPDPDALPPLERAFYGARWLSQTCPFDPGRPALLTGEVDGFNAKVEALLGVPLSAAFLRNGDPEAPLDFSRAPHLALIYVSYLDIKADFSGRVFDRLLRYHARQGATIRVIASDVLEREKDRAMLQALAADHLNVQFKSFAWKAPNGGTLDEVMSEYYKVHHSKLLAAISEMPGRSVAIIGGRNIHDGFLFDEPVDLSRYPQLQQYGQRRGLTLNYYSNWRDLDLALHDDAATRSLAAHLSTLWHEDAVTHMVRPFSLSVAGGAVRASGSARHFVSVPYVDGRALEGYYVDLLDAATRTIEIVNPYLNLTPALEAAIDRALARGVAITILGRIDLTGDLGGSVLTELNRLFVARHADRIHIYDYRDPKVILHSKMLMIDGRFAIASSVNLNNRSFVHDNENGIAVLDPAFYRRMKAVFETYRKASVPVVARDVGLGWRILFSWRQLREAL